VSKPERLPSARSEQTYFLTTNTDQRRRIFQVKAQAELMVEILFHYRNKDRYSLHAFVIMPHHLHLILTPESDTTLERGMQFIKGGFSFRVSRELGRKGEVWQRGFTDRRLRVGEYRAAQDYVHQNPVVAGMCERAEEYLYSSANGRFVMDPIPNYLSG
jgi:putative transposase